MWIHDHLAPLYSTPGDPGRGPEKVDVSRLCPASSPFVGKNVEDRCDLEPEIGRPDEERRRGFGGMRDGSTEREQALSLANWPGDFSMERIDRTCEIDPILDVDARDG